MTKIYLNGQLTDTTPALDTVLAELGTRATTAKKARHEAEAQTKTDKTTGNQKLLDLGLTQAEVDAITGQ